MKTSKKRYKNIGLTFFIGYLMVSGVQFMINACFLCLISFVTLHVIKRLGMLEIDQLCIYSHAFERL